MKATNTCKSSDPTVVTVFTREHDSTRRLINSGVVVKALETSGLHVRVLTELSNLSFHQQVCMFSRINVFIAPHGGWSTNIFFMPAWSIIFTIMKGATVERSQKTFQLWDQPHSTPTSNLDVILHTTSSIVACTFLFLNKSSFGSCQSSCLQANAHCHIYSADGGHCA